MTIYLKSSFLPFQNKIFLKTDFTFFSNSVSTDSEKKILTVHVFLTFVENPSEQSSLFSLFMDKGTFVSAYKNNNLLCITDLFVLISTTFMTFCALECACHQIYVFSAVIAGILVESLFPSIGSYL